MNPWFLSTLGWVQLVAKSGIELTPVRLGRAGTFAGSATARGPESQGYPPCVSHRSVGRRGGQSIAPREITDDPPEIFSF